MDLVEPLLDLLHAARELLLHDVAVLDLALAVVRLLALLVHTGDDEVLGEELLVVLPGAHVVVGNRVEGPAEGLGVHLCGARPQALEVGVEGILDELVTYGPPIIMVGCRIDGPPVVVRAVPALIGQEAEVLAEDVPAQGGGEGGGGERLAGHLALDRGGILDDDGDLGVVGAQLGAVVEVGGAADDEAVVGDEELAVDVELLADEGADLVLGVAVPAQLRDAGAAVHVAGADGVEGRVPDGGGLALVPPVLVRVLALALAVPAAHVPVVASAGVFVRDAGALLGLVHGPGGVDAIKVAQVVEADVVARVDPRLTQLLEYAVAPTADGEVLELHDGAGSQRALGLEVSREGGHGGHDDPDPERLALLIGPDDAINHGGADLIGYGELFIAGCCDEELVCRCE